MIHRHPLHVDRNACVCGIPLKQTICRENNNPSVFTIYTFDYWKSVRAPTEYNILYMSTSSSSSRAHKPNTYTTGMLVMKMRSLSFVLLASRLNVNILLFNWSFMQQHPFKRYNSLCSVCYLQASGKIVPLPNRLLA